MRDLFRGKLVRLSVDDPETRAKADARWRRDTEYHRLADGDPATLWSEKSLKERMEKRMEREDLYDFSIRSLVDDRLIGETALVVQWSHRHAWVGIGIGERDMWDKGYGTDAMRLILQYAFTELNLRRVSLMTNGYNARAQRSYEKAGFRFEGVLRQDQLKEGQRFDTVVMGILCEEWLATDSQTNSVGASQSAQSAKSVDGSRPAAVGSRP